MALWLDGCLKCDFVHGCIRLPRWKIRPRARQIGIAMLNLSPPHIDMVLNSKEPRLPAQEIQRPIRGSHVTVFQLSPTAPAAP